MFDNIFRTFELIFHSIKSPEAIDFTELLQLREVLDGADHLAGVAVLVVIPGHDLHLIGVVVDEPLLRNGSRCIDPAPVVGLFTCQIP